MIGTVVRSPLETQRMNQSGEATVFVLDDEPAMRDSLQCLLESERYRVRTFDSPIGFLQAELTRPACLILDLTMPEMSGMEVLRIVNETRPLLPTVVLTGYADVSTAVSAMRLGAIHLLEKPCRDNELLNAVQEAMSESVREVAREQQSESLRIKLRRLSPRERELLDLFVQGLDVKLVAQQMGTSPNTVRNQRASIMAKLEVDSSADLVRVMLNAQA